MKGGPSRYDMHNLNILIERGLSVEEISKRMRIHVEGLEPYMPKTHPKKKRVAKKKVKPKEDA